MEDNIIMKTNQEGDLLDYINPSLDIKNLSRKQVKELAKEIANGESKTHSWREVANDAVVYDSKNDRQEKRFKRIFNKQLNQNLAPILEKQHKRELINRMKNGDPSAMGQWTSEGINKFGHQFMPVMLTAATLPFGIGAFGQAANTIGWLPALGAEAGSWGLGYGWYKLGEKLDDDFGTNWIAPVLSVAGGVGGYGAGYKGMVKLGGKGWLPKGDNFMYGSKFIGDVTTDAFNKNIKTTVLNPSTNTVAKTKYKHPRQTSVDIVKSAYPGFPSSATISVYDDSGALIGKALAEEKDGYLIPQLMNNLTNGKQGHLSFDLYDGMIAASEKLGLKGVRSGDRLMSPEKTRRIWEYYRQQGLLEDLDNFGFDIKNGVGQPRVILRKPITTTDNIVFGTSEFQPPKSTGSYAFFERPSKLTLAERMGIPKGDRANLTVDQLEGLEDLMRYNTSGKYRWRLTYNDKTGFARTTAANQPEGSIPGVKALLDAGAEPKTVIRYATKTGNWNVWPNRPNVPATFSGGDFPIPEGMGWAPGDLSLMLDGSSGKGLKVIMTSPRVDLINSLDDVPQTLIESLPNTIDKNIMRRFWQNNDQVILPGSYLSGDNGTLPLGLNGISAIDQGKGMSGAISEILHPARFKPHGSGLSPDSMLSILKQGQRPGHAVRYGPGFTQLNNSAVYNKHIYDAWTKYKSGAMTADEFKTIFDDWFVPQGGRPLEIKISPKFRRVRDNNGNWTLVQQEQKPYIVFPHPYVHYKKKGGKINPQQ